MSGPLTLADLLAPQRGAELADELAALRQALAPGGSRVYLVGGLVRDLLLGRSSRDIDLAVAGPVAELADRLAAALGGEARHHPAFMTASFRTRRGFTVDLARLRRESYREPGALPEVARGTLAEDLFRRDFSVNAMAVDLARETSRLIDFHDGFEDLAAGRLRVLHPESFRDDPTRVFRGLRIGFEIGLSFDPQTHRLAAQASTRDALARVSGFRLWRELRACFATPAAARGAVSEIDALGLVAAIHPALVGVPIADDLGAESTPLEALAAWCEPLARPQRWELAERLALTRDERLAIGVRPPRHPPRPR